MIRLQNLTKYYGKRLAVNNINLNIEHGEIVGFLGPNGAGKTTTMRMITGYLLPTDGQVFVGDLDMDTHSLEARKLIGYMPEHVPLYAEMSTYRFLEFVAQIRGLNRKRTKSRIDEVVEICGLEEYRNVILGKLSKGFQQRVGLAQAIIHEPKILILDEPTAGIDPIQVVHTRELIRELGKDHTILLSTHILPEVNMVCERAVFIHRGTIVAEDRIENLSSVIRGGNGLRLKVVGPAEEVSARLVEIEGIDAVTYSEPYHLVQYPSDATPQSAIIDLMIENGWDLLFMESAEMSLEDIFLELTSKGEN